MKRLAAALAAALLTVTIAAVPRAGRAAAIRAMDGIPGITAEERAGAEALRGETLLYGALLATEAFERPDGGKAGFAQEMCELLSELFGLTVELRIYGDWDRLIEDFERGELAFTGELTATAERRAKGYLMTEPIAERMLRAFVRKDSERKNEADLAGARVGFLEGSTTAEEIESKYGASFRRVSVRNYEDAAERIRTGEIDAFIEEAVSDPFFDVPAYDFIRSQIVYPMIHAPVSLSSARGDAAPVLAAFDRYLAAGGVDRLYELYKRGDRDYAKYKLRKSLTPEELAFVEGLAEKGEPVRVAFEHDNYPVDFFNDKDGLFEGIAVDVLREIGELTGLAFEPAVGSRTTWADIFAMLGSGEVRMVAQLLKSEARRDHFLWGDAPYAVSYYALMSRSDFPSLETYQVARASVGAMRGSGKLDVFFELFPEHAGVALYDTQYDCLDALERGEIDLLMASEYMLLTQINYREKSDFKINIKLDAPLESYFGYVADAEGALLKSIIDKAQRFVKTDAIEISWTGRNFDYSRKIAEERTRYALIFSCVMLAVLACAVAMLISNKRLSRTLREMANHDPLTGICNRRFFMELAAYQVARSLRTGIDCFVIILDLDHFKLVNDTYGHQAGDRVLREVAARVKAMIRPYDVFGRYGGEEFILLMTDIKEMNKPNVMSAAERIRDRIAREPIEYEGARIRVTASFGIAYAAPHNDLETATGLADEALYRAKESGRDRVVFNDDEGMGRG